MHISNQGEGAGGLTVEKGLRDQYEDVEEHTVAQQSQSADPSPGVACEEAAAGQRRQSHRAVAIGRLPALCTNTP